MSSRTACKADPGPSERARRSWLPALRCAAAGITALFSLAACSRKPADAPIAYLDLDCAKPFDAQVAAVTAQPKLVPAGVVGSEPYSYYSSADGSVSYLVTRPGSPAHPAIMIQRARNGVHTNGCAYGDRKAHDELLAYLEGLKTWTRKGGT